MARTRKLHIDNDAAMQKKAIKVLRAILARDVRSLNPVKTQALSNRVLILDDPTVPSAIPSNKPLTDACNLLIDRFVDNLAETITL